jgi:hypothetical protein
MGSRSSIAFQAVVRSQIQHTIMDNPQSYRDHGAMDGAKSAVCTCHVAEAYVE